MTDQKTGRKRSADRADEPPTLVLKRGVRSDDQTQIMRFTATGTTLLPRIADAPPPPDEPTAAAGRPPRLPWWTQLLVFLVPVAIAFPVAWRGLGNRQLWYDEHATWHAATLSWGDLGTLLGNIDRVVALYYTFMHGWIGLFGDGPTALRLPSVLAIAIAAGATGLIGQRLLDAPTGVLAGALFAVLPAVSRYAQEARPYAFAIAGAAVATWLLLVALDRPRWPWWLLYAFVVALTAYFHVVAVLVLAAHAVLGWSRYRRSERDVRLWKALGALALIAALVMPLAYAAKGQSFAIDWIKADLDTVQQLPRQLFGSVAVAAAFAGMAVLAAVTLPLARRRTVLLALLAWALVPPLLTYVTFPVLHLFLFRYLLFTLPAWALLCAGATFGLIRLITVRAWPQILVGAVLVPAAVLLALPAHEVIRQDLEPGEPDYHAAAAVVSAELAAGDGIVYAGTARPPRLGMAYEMRDVPRPDDVLVSVPSEQLGDFGVRECPITSTCVAKRERLWLVSTSYSQDPWSEMSPEKALALKRLFAVTEPTHHRRIHVYLLVLKSD
ncbi:MAG TPA: glycosyltransferase family 39 protein [Asanoa sp.]|nr:glycosyltransferase family 39 protein [Asanoa sp.]